MLNPLRRRHRHVDPPAPSHEQPASAPVEQLCEALRRAFGHAMNREVTLARVAIAVAMERLAPVETELAEAVRRHRGVVVANGHLRRRVANQRKALRELSKLRRQEYIEIAALRADEQRLADFLDEHGIADVDERADGDELLSTAERAMRAIDPTRAQHNEPREWTLTGRCDPLVSGTAEDGPLLEADERVRVREIPREASR